MKIICNKDEFAMLVRFCERYEYENACRGCLFECVCTKGEELCEGAWMSRIEDVCEIGDGSNG